MGMRLWTRLFGRGETAAQRCARAAQHCEDGEYELALRLVEDVDGEPAESLRQRARDGIASREQGPTRSGPASLDGARRGRSAVRARTAGATGHTRASLGAVR
jgi:hypothetical protein